MNVPDLHRWPLLLGAAVCFGVALWLVEQTDTTTDGTGLAYALTALGAVLIGAFIYDTAAAIHRKDEQ